MFAFNILQLFLDQEQHEYMVYTYLVFLLIGMMLFKKTKALSFQIRLG